jgi:2-oxoglutarate dehydrogenase E2 component (dihydrolipoamide succinyltransferase)
MGVDIKVPPMGESITEVTVGALLVQNGSIVKEDQEIIEFETDKVNQVLNAPKGGKISFTVNVDDTVRVGQVIGSIDPSAAGETTTEEAKVDIPAAAKTAAPIAKQTIQAPSPAPAPAQMSMGSARFGTNEFVADLQKGLTGPTPAPASLASEEAAPSKASREESRSRLPKIRKVIAERLLEAQHTTAMLTTFNEVDMSAVMAMRDQYKDAFLKKHGAKLGFMSFFVKAVVYALQEIPSFNSYIDGNELVERHYYDIGIAVGTEKGLFVPVVRDCDDLSFAKIEQEIVRYANKARDGSISVDDLNGGCFTITNGGIYGSLLSTPILNPPQTGILGMHKIEKRAVVVNDQIVIRPMMYLALSYDHRVADGKEAVTFLVKVKECLEDPSRLLLSV